MSPFFKSWNWGTCFILTLSHSSGEPFDLMVDEKKYRYDLSHSPPAHTIKYLIQKPCRLASMCRVSHLFGGPRQFGKQFRWWALCSNDSRAMNKLNLSHSPPTHKGPTRRSKLRVRKRVGDRCHGVTKALVYFVGFNGSNSLEDNLTVILAMYWGYTTVVDHDSHAINNHILKFNQESDLDHPCSI